MQTNDRFVLIDNVKHEVLVYKGKRFLAKFEIVAGSDLTVDQIEDVRTAEYGREKHD